MVNINSDQGNGGMRSDFERTVAHLLPYCPVAKKKAVGNKRGAGKISEITADGADISAFGTKSGRGPKTGVHLCYHAFPEYKKLTPDERAELHEWRETPEGKAATLKGKTKKKGSSGGKVKEVHFSEKAIAAAVDKKLAAKEKATAEDKSNVAAVDGYIMSCIHRLAGSTPAPTTVPTASAGSATANIGILKNIIGRAQNNGSRG
jgi:hypothetical protein